MGIRRNNGLYGAIKVSRRRKKRFSLVLAGIEDKRFGLSYAIRSFVVSYHCGGVYKVAGGTQS